MNKEVTANPPPFGLTLKRKIGASLIIDDLYSSAGTSLIPVRITCREIDEAEAAITIEADRAIPIVRNRAKNKKPPNNVEPTGDICSLSIVCSTVYRSDYFTVHAHERGGEPCEVRVGLKQHSSTQVKIVIEAPRSVSVDREEVWESINKIA